MVCVALSTLGMRDFAVRQFHRHASNADKVKSLSTHHRFVIAWHSPNGVVATGRVCPSKKKTGTPACGVDSGTFSGPV
jgi:hypothetical protein